MLGSAADQIRREQPITELATVARNNVVPLQKDGDGWFIDVDGLQERQN